MKNRKINVDRPQLTAQEVMAGKNFESVLRNHQMMSKPFYKQTWFYGTVGFASIGLILGGAWLFQDEPGERLNQQSPITAAPPSEEMSRPNLLAANFVSDEYPMDNPDKTIQLNPSKSEHIEENTTSQENVTESDQSNQVINETTVIDVNDNQEELEQQTSVKETEVAGDVEAPVPDQPKEVERNFALDMSPRISNKLGGSITRGELLDNKGITTEGDVNVIHFELHLIDGLGGKVLTEDSNQLNDEMKAALEAVGAGETIYFENIRGKIKDGQEVRLNPLRYVLMN